MNADDRQIGRLALHGVAWSIAQNWGGRVFTFLLFIVLARFLSPAQFGLVAAATILLTLVGLVAEFGFGDAIVQRRDYVPADANLPFYVSVCAAIALAVLCGANAPRIGKWLGVPGLEPIVVALVFVAPLSTISLFQEANYRRAFAFRKLALRVFVANMLAGALAVAAAVAGFGVWSLVVQTYAATLIGLAWLWTKPVWRPSLEVRVRSFLELARFGTPVVTMRLFDFATTRFFEILLLGRYGVAVYGLYAAGARLYQTLMQLLQSALSDVSLTVLSRIAHDRDRMAQIYQQAIVISAFVFAPIFVGCAALIPEISSVLFGARWDGVEDVARPLLLLGAIQSVQFLNGAYLAARGKPGLVLFISSLKNVAIPLGVLFVPAADVVQFVQIFAVAQLLGTPFSFGLTMHELRVPVRSMLLHLLPAVAACLAGDLAVQMLRPFAKDLLPSPLASGTGLGCAFVALYFAVIMATGRREFKMIRQFVKNRMKSK